MKNKENFDNLGEINKDNNDIHQPNGLNNHIDTKSQKIIPTTLNFNSLLQNEIKNSIIEFTKRKKTESKQRTSTRENTIKKMSKSKSTSDLISQKFKKYDTQSLMNQIAKEYSKINFTNEKDFLTRMELYASKNILKEIKIEEIVKQKQFHFSEKKRISVFNRLIKDSNKRADLKERVDKLKEDLQVKRPQSAKSFNKEKWNQIYQERFLKKFIDKKKFIDEQKEENKRKEEEEIEKQMSYLNKKNGKKFQSEKELKELTNRLYYTPYLKRQTKKAIDSNNIIGTNLFLMTNHSMIEKKNNISKKSTNHFDMQKIKNNNSKKHKRYVSYSRVEKLIDDFFESK